VSIRLNAYVLLAEPEWLEESIRSYYHLVDRIIACYDERDVGWAGGPIRARECVERITAIDVEGKVELLGGHFSRSDDPMENDTLQRREALAAASEGCDWILQIDTDELVPRPESLLDAIKEAARVDRDVLRFPNRLIRQHLYADVYLEESTRLWQPLGGTLPIAVRPGVEPTFARESGGSAFTVGYRRRRLVPGRRPDATVTPGEALIHMSWVRTPVGMSEKFAAWGHARDRDWRPVLRRWHWMARHPRLAVLATPFSRMPFVGRVRRVRLPGVPMPGWLADSSAR
jgi:hypothetical protein